MDISRYYDPEGVVRFIRFVDRERSALRERISAALEEFEKRTMLQVKDISINRLVTEGGDGTPSYGVKIEVEYNR